MSICKTEALYIDLVFIDWTMWETEAYAQNLFRRAVGGVHVDEEGMQGLALSPTVNPSVFNVPVITPNLSHAALKTA